MAISNSIDGTQTSGSDQVLSLISLISDPVTYKQRIAELEAATAENRKFVELVAPARDILSLKEKVVAELEAAKAASKAAADTIEAQLREARAAAQDIMDRAGVIARQSIEQASADRAAAEASAVEAAKELAGVKSDRAALKKAAKEAQEARDAANAIIAEAEAAKAAANDLREALIAKHKAFIESLG